MRPMRPNRDDMHMRHASACAQVTRAVTTPERLGCIGGSNGGLLMGNMLTREGRALFGATVCQVPPPHMHLGCNPMYPGCSPMA